MLKIKNSLTKSLQEVREELVEIYLCGHTAYKPPHLGNMRPVLVFDLMIRLLRDLGQKVIYVRNTTDIDDKIIEEAERQGTDIQTVTERASSAHRGCEELLGCIPPTLNPHATGYIRRILELVQEFIDKDVAYEAEGNVFFRVPKLGSKIDFYPSEFRFLDKDSCKQDQRDFVLWKAAKPGEPSWPSLYGLGRPGWHTECVAMILETTKNLTIHGGGCDLSFPHHANELLQLKQCGHAPKIWVHTGMLVDGEGKKMSKSLENTVDFLELAEHIPPVILRIALLSTHYSHPLPWTPDKLKQAEKTWVRLLQKVQKASYRSAEKEPCEQVLEALRKNLNTPEAFTKLDSLSDEKLFYTMYFLGLFDAAHLPTKTSQEEVQEYVKQYSEAKTAGNYAKSDAIRSALEEDGIHIRQDASWYCGLPKNYQTFFGKAS